MPAQLQAVLDRLTGAVKQFSMAQRTLGIIGIAVLVLGAVFLSSTLNKPTLSPLFTSLSGADASAVVDQLTSDGVKYELSDGGSTVLVPADKLYGERIKLAAAGLPTNADGGGYSLLDNMPMTASEFQQQKTYQRALEGELAKTIGAIDGVQAATVKLAVPEDTVFVDKKADPTASVFVRTTPGATLNPGQVQSIVHLVSAGIPDMKPSDVAVVDSTGQVLSTVGADAGATGMADQQTTDYEGRVSAAVQKLLDRVVGPGNAAVTVNARLNYDETSTTKEEFSAPTPSTAPLASSTKVEEYSGGAAGATGVLGPDNIAVPGGSPTSGAYKSTSEDVTNSVNKSTEVTKAAPGGVERQSVAVAVNAGAAAGIDMTNLQAMVAAAAGIDTTRGDTIQVQSMAFDTTQAKAAKDALAEADAATKAGAQNALIEKGAIGGAILIGLIILIIIIAFARRSSRKARRTSLDLGELALNGGDDALALEGADVDAIPALPAAPLPLAPDPIALKRAEIGALAEDQPEEIADLLRGWLSEPGGVRR